MRQLSFVSLALAFTVASFGSTAAAVTVNYEDFRGAASQCVGPWSAASFDDCAAPDRDGYAGGEMMASFTLRGKNAGNVRLASNSGSLLPSFFSMMYRGKGKSGSWTFDPTGCDDCFDITSFVIRSGKVSRWYYSDSETGLFSGDWRGLGKRGIQSIAFYGQAGQRTSGPAGEQVTTETSQDTPAPSVVPVPATGLLLLGGIAVMAGLRRRHRKAV